MSNVTIKAVASQNPVTGEGTITYELYIDGKFQVGNIANVLDAIDLKIQNERYERASTN